MTHLLNAFIYIAKGTGTTLKIYVITAIFSVPLGVIFALGKVTKSRILRTILEFYTWIFRGTPLMLQLFFTYFGLPVIFNKFSIQFNITPLTAAAVTFILNYSAYLTEIFRAGIESIDKGQYEASKVLSMNYSQTMFRIIIPQAFRRVLPPMCNEAINLVKDTALVFGIGMADLLRNAKEIVTREFVLYPFIMAAAIYLLITSVIVIIFKKLEKKFLLN